MASSAFGKTYDPGVIPAKQLSVPMEATRVACHKENVTNDLAPINNKGKTPAMGKEGIKGSGQDT